jgi:hypothetical protein
VGGYIGVEKCGTSVVDVSTDEFGIDFTVGGKLAGCPNSCHREIESDHSCAVPSPRQSVGSQVALEVYQIKVSDSSQLDQLEGPDVIAPGAKAG